jgi:hypothetical protein
MGAKMKKKKTRAKRQATNRRKERVQLIVTHVVGEAGCKRRKEEE